MKAVLQKAMARMADDEMEPGDQDLIADAIVGDASLAAELADLWYVDELLRIEAEESISGCSPFVAAMAHRCANPTDAHFLQRVEQSTNAAERPRPWRRFILAVAAACIVIALSPLGQESNTRSGKISNAPFEPIPVTDSIESRSTFVDDTAAARLVRYTAAAGIHQLPETFDKGTYNLPAGIAELALSNGVTAIVAGPATFTISRPDRIQLESGRIRVQVPLNALGFQVRTPTHVVTDLGTVFAVATVPNGVFVRTYSGLVEVAAVNSSEATRLPAPKAAWFGVAAQPEPTIPTRRDLLEANASDRLDWLLDTFEVIALYDFQVIGQSQRLVNRANPGHADGTIRGAQTVQGRWPGRTALQFENTGDAVALQIPDEVTDFTIAAWLKIDRLDTAYGTILNADGWEPGVLHFQVMIDGEINLGLGPDEKHREQDPVAPFVYWNAPPGSVAAGSWLHVAVVGDATDKTVTHYVDGQKVSTRSAPSLRPATFGACTIGAWNGRSPTEAPRPFRGRIDELVFIGEKLSDADVYLLAKPH